MEPQAVRVWNVTLVNGKKIRAATIEQGPRKPSPLCEGCYAKCCRGSIAPVLNSEEFLSRKFKANYMVAPEWLKEQVPNAEFLVTLAVSKDGCPYFDKKNLKCTLWNTGPPKSCLAYDCREDSRPEMKKFAKKREREWRKSKNVSHN